jgi:hypothetical protein
MVVRYPVAAVCAVLAGCQVGDDLSGKRFACGSDADCAALTVVGHIRSIA